MEGNNSSPAMHALNFFFYLCPAFLRDDGPAIGPLHYDNNLEDCGSPLVDLLANLQKQNGLMRVSEPNSGKEIVYSGLGRRNMEQLSGTTNAASRLTCTTTTHDPGRACE